MKRIRIPIVVTILLFFISCDSKYYKESNKNNIDSEVSEKVISWHDSAYSHQKQVLDYDKSLKRYVYKYYRFDGSLKSIIPLKDGKMNGTVKYFHRNGLVSFEIDHVNGIKDGNMKSFSNEGTLMSTGKYKRGKKDGEWKYFSSNGNLKRTEVYKEGILTYKVVELE